MNQSNTKKRTDEVSLNLKKNDVESDYILFDRRVRWIFGLVLVSLDTPPLRKAATQRRKQQK
jgi:hypothetical protein